MWKMVAWTVIGAVAGFGVTFVLYGSAFLPNFPNRQNLIEGMAFGGFSIIPGAALAAAFGAARIILQELGEIRREMSRHAVWKMAAWTVIGAVVGFGVTLAVYGSAFFTNVPNRQNLTTGLIYGAFSIIPGAAVGATFGAARIILKELGEIRHEMNRHQMLSQTTSDVNEPSASIMAGLPPEGWRK